MPFPLKENTIRAFHDEVVKRYGRRPFLFFEGEEPISYEQYGEQAAALRKQLISLGLQKADRIALLGPASPQWAIAFMAVMSCGMVSVPIMEDFPPEDIDHILKDSGARCCLIDPAVLERADRKALRERGLVSLRDFSVIQAVEQPYEPEEAAVFLDAQTTEEPLPDAASCFKTTPQDVAELLYTSGTTGHSKAVLLTHNNLVTNLYEGTDLIDECFDRDSTVLSLLPLAHSFGSTSAFLSTMYKGPKICFLKRKPSPDYLLRVFRSVQPTILGGVPLIFEKIYQKRILPLINGHAFLKAAVSIGLVRKLFHRLAGRSVLASFGGKIRCIIIGGANFSREVERFMREARIPYVLGYGLTETSPLLTFSSLRDARFGSVGHAVGSTDLRIAGQNDRGIGEIQAKGPQVMKGYYKKPEETAAVFTPDGWFRTGDLGCLDRDGFLYIKGRSKNVIVGNSGENIYPEVIETLLATYKAVEEALVLQKNSRLTAMVYPSDQAGQNTDLSGQLEEVRQDVNRRLPAASRIHAIEIREVEFEKTPTKKIKRALYIQDY